MEEKEERTPKAFLHSRRAISAHKACLSSFPLSRSSGYWRWRSAPLWLVYGQYSEARAAASDRAAYHLKRLQALLEPDLKHPSIPDVATISTARRELVVAQRDFALVRREISGKGLFFRRRRIAASRGERLGPWRHAGGGGGRSVSELDSI